MRKICLSILMLTALHIDAESYLFDFTNPRAEAYLMRLASAHVMTLEQPNHVVANEHNGDDQNVADYAGSFHKTLEHDAVTGLLTAQGKINYEQLLTALESALQADFNAIVRAPESIRKFVSPQGGFARSLMGISSCLISVLPAPTLTSAQAAADMIEDYLHAIARDVSFSDFGTGANTDLDDINGGSITNNAAAILTALADAYKGPSNNGIVTIDKLFRGTSAGDLVGLYVSQFWYFPLHLHLQNVEVKQQVPAAGEREFGVAWDDFVAIQNGKIPKPYQASDFLPSLRYIINAKDMGTIVHVDPPGDCFINAANILLYNKAPLSPALPYYNGSMPNEDAFVNMITVDIYSSVLAVAQEGLMHAWVHKWRASRRLRPETMAGHVHRAKITNTNPLSLDSSLFATYGSINLLEWVKANNAKQETISTNSLPAGQGHTYLLPLLYPEGSPIHPSYPAGHATVAGACTTVLKAFFDDTQLLYEIPGLAPVKPDISGNTLLLLSEPEGSKILTIGGELDKLASNVAYARNWAGIHYRADAENSLLLGEELALRYLQDRARRYTEQAFSGFELTKRNGQRVRVTPEAITVIE